MEFIQANYAKSGTNLSLMFDRGLNRTNQKLRTKIKVGRKIKIDVEIRAGVQLHKIININPIGDAIRAVTN